MKTFVSFLAIIFVFIVGCEQDDFPESGDGISITIENKVILTAKDIDYYDLSTHFIYLKGTNSFLDDKLTRDSF